MGSTQRDYNVMLHARYVYYTCITNNRIRHASRIHVSKARRPRFGARSRLSCHEGETTRAKIQEGTGRHSCGVIRHEAIQTHQAIHHRAQDEDRPTTSAHYFRFAGHAASSVESISCFTCARISIYIDRMYMYVCITARTDATSTIVSVARSGVAWRRHEEDINEQRRTPPPRCVYAYVRMTETRLKRTPGGLAFGAGAGTEQKRLVGPVLPPPLRHALRLPVVFSLLLLLFLLLPLLLLLWCSFFNRPRKRLPMIL